MQKEQRVRMGEHAGVSAAVLISVIAAALEVCFNQASCGTLGKSRGL